MAELTRLLALKKQDFREQVENQGKLQKKIEDAHAQAQQSYDSALGQLSTGAGNLLNQATQLKKLGARNTKEIDAKLAEQAAEAIEAEHGYGPQVATAVDRSHQAMGALQKETLEHIFAMRAVLRPDQTDKFDDAVVKALTAKSE